MSVEIIGTGYGKKVEVGESFLKEAVVNMWVRPPEGAFLYCSSNGHQMVLEEHTYKGNGVSSYRCLVPNEITEEIKLALIAKGNII